MGMATPSPRGESGSPLTDFRALSSSVVFHALLALLTSVLVLDAVLPSAHTQDSGPLYGELGPVDSRVEVVGPGGGPGDLGGTLSQEAVEVTADPSRALAPIESPFSASTEATADALLEDVLAAPAASDADALPMVSLPSLSGVGALPGPGTGGGGGSGGGSGGGIGPGLGAGTEFFGTEERAASFGYVIDRSGSMTDRGAINLAKRELLASLRRLPPDTRFGVVFYDNAPTTFLDTGGRPSLMPATTTNKARLEDRLAQITADGGTNHEDALRAGIALKPEVIFFLTDGQDLNDRQANDLIRDAGAIRIHAVEFGIGPDTGTSVPLRTLAYGTGGTYRYIDVMALTRAARIRELEEAGLPDAP